MCPQMFTERALLSRNGYGGAFAFVMKVVSDFLDEFADRPPCFNFPAFFKEFGVIWRAFHKVKPAASWDFEVPQFQLGNTRPARIILCHSCKAEIDYRMAKQKRNVRIGQEAVEQ